MKPVIGLNRIVSNHPFLSGVSPSVRRIFCQCASMQAFSEGQSLFLEGGPAEFFYLINAGQILLKVYVPGRDSMSIQAVGPGEALGWSWLFPPFQWHFSAMAVEPAETIAFPAKTLRDIAQMNHKFCYELVLRLAAVVTHRLEDVRQRLVYAGQGLN